MNIYILDVSLSKTSIMKHYIFFLGIIFFSTRLFAQNQIIEDYTVTQCDSLIKANVINPNFVILDVRTAAEYNPQHLEGAIMRDFYANDFEAQLDVLNKEKVYLIHCRSGGRSGATLTKMQNLGFKEVYNMLGGMIAWNAKSLPTTSEFAPKLMFVSGASFTLDTVLVGDIDTTTVTITNRANSTLELTKLSILNGDNFSTDIDLPQNLLGAEDYSFHIFYEPTSPEVVTGNFYLESNDGAYDIDISRVGKMTTDVKSINHFSLKISPNPATDFIQIDGVKSNTVVEIINQNGQIILRKEYADGLDISGLEVGLYWVMLKDGASWFVGELDVY